MRVSVFFILVLFLDSPKKSDKCLGLLLAVVVQGGSFCFCFFAHFFGVFFALREVSQFLAPSASFGGFFSHGKKHFEFTFCCCLFICLFCLNKATSFLVVVPVNLEVSFSQPCPPLTHIIFAVFYASICWFFFFLQNRTIKLS